MSERDDAVVRDLTRRVRAELLTASKEVSSRVVDANVAYFTLEFTGFGTLEAEPWLDALLDDDAVRDVRVHFPPVHRAGQETLTLQLDVWKDECAPAARERLRAPYQHHAHSDQLAFDVRFDDVRDCALVRRLFLYVQNMNEDMPVSQAELVVLGENVVASLNNMPPVRLGFVRALRLEFPALRRVVLASTATAANELQLELPNFGAAPQNSRPSRKRKAEPPPPPPLPVNKHAKRSVLSSLKGVFGL